MSVKVMPCDILFGSRTISFATVGKGRVEAHTVFSL